MIFANIEAEQQLLGCIMINNDAHAMVADMLHAQDFAEPLHGRIFDIASARIEKGHLASPVTMRLALEGDPALKELGGPAYLARMAGAAVAVPQAREYAKAIIEASCRRALNTASEEAASRLRMGEDSGEVRLRLLQAVSGLPEVGEESSFSLASAVVDATRHAVEAYQGNSTFLKTGLGSLDRIIKGLSGGDSVLVGGATSMGKTSLALEIAKNVSLAGRGVAFVSLEMTRQELATRIVSQSARVPYAELRDPEAMQEGDFRKWIEAARGVGDLPMRVIPKHVRDIHGIHAAVKRAGLALPGGKVDLVVVDYAQLVRGTGKTRYEQMTDVSISLKHMAGLLGCPVISLVQLSRDIGNRDDKRPQLSDIKETGQFENDADVAIFCHREGYWLERQGPKANAKGDITEQAKLDWKADLEAVRNKIELIVRKNRHGRNATAEMFFHAPTMRFAELKDQLSDFA